MNETDTRELINKIIKITGEDFIESYFENELGELDLNKIIPILSEERNIGVISRLKQIVTVGQSYFDIVSIDGFISFLGNRYKFDAQDYSSIYEIIYTLSNSNKKIFNSLSKNCDISFGGTFHFFEISEGHTKKINTRCRENLININDEFRLLSKSASLILPYNPLNVNDYYIVHYGSKKNNKEIKEYITEVTNIDSSNSFYFCFKEISNKHFLIIKRPFHEVKIGFLIDALNKVLSIGCSHTPFDIVSLQQLKNGISFDKYLLQVPSINISHLDYSGITFSLDGPNWSSALKDIFNDSGDKIKIHSLKYKYEHYIGTKMDISISGSIKANEVKIIGENLEIDRVINILNHNSVGLISSNLDNIFSEEELLIQILFGNSIILEKKHIEFFTSNPSYVKEFEYIGSGIEGKNGVKIQKDNIYFSKNILHINGESDSIYGNLKLLLDTNKILIEKVDKDIFIEYVSGISIVKFLKGKNKNIIILLSDDEKKISHYLLKNSNSSKKYIFFTNTEISTKEQISLADKKAIGFGKNSLGRFIKDFSKAIFEESSKIIINGDNGKKISLDELSSIDFIELSLSGNGIAFEDAIAKVLPRFFPIFVQFGRKYTGKAIPDGLIRSKGANSNELYAFYDAKSSGKIIEYIKEEDRKICDYIELFPLNNQNCIFIVFGADALSSKIEDLKQNVIWKKTINDKKGKILYIGAKTLDFLKYIITYDEFDAVKGYLRMEPLTQYFLDQLKIPNLVYFDLESFKKEVLDSFISDPGDTMRDISKEIKDRTQDKMNISEQHSKFREYISKYPTIND